MKKLLLIILLIVGCATNTINNTDLDDLLSIIPPPPPPTPPAPKVQVWGLNDPFEESVKIYGNYPSFSDYRFSIMANAMMNTGRGLKSHYILIASIDKKIRILYIL